MLRFDRFAPPRKPVTVGEGRGGMGWPADAPKLYRETS